MAKVISTRKLLLMVFWGANLALGVGCTSQKSGGNDPEARLKGYIYQSFNMNGPQDRESLSRFLAGPAKTRLAAWSEDQFRAAFLDTKRQFVKLVFAEIKKPTAKQVDITYELTYLDQGKGRDAKVTHKKLAQLSLDKDQWYISDVRNMKELIEYQNEMSLP